MKYFQSWQDFMRMPENKALKESKGIHACKQKFIQEQNRMQWYDPMILQEQGPSDLSLVSPAAAGGGGSVGFITGQTAEVNTFTWASGSSGITGSLTFVIHHNAIQGAQDYSYGHGDMRKKMLMVFCTSSTAASITGISTSGYDVVVTSSIKQRAGADTNESSITGSWANEMSRSIDGQSATAVVLGFTNTIAPKTLVTFATASVAAGSTTFTITNRKKGAVGNVSMSGMPSGTGSISVSTQGNDTWQGGTDQGSIIFNSVDVNNNPVLPYASFPYDSGDILT